MFPFRLCEEGKPTFSYKLHGRVRKPSCETNLNVAWYNESNIPKEDDFACGYKISVIFVKTRKDSLHCEVFFFVRHSMFCLKDKVKDKVETLSIYDADRQTNET